MFLSLFLLFPISVFSPLFLYSFIFSFPLLITPLFILLFILLFPRFSALSFHSHPRPICSLRFISLNHPPPLFSPFHPRLILSLHLSPPSSPSLFLPLQFSLPSATIFLSLPSSPHIISPPLPAILAIFVSSASVLSTIRHHFSLPAILSFHPSLPYSHFLPLSPPSAPVRRAKSYSS